MRQSTSAMSLVLGLMIATAAFAPCSSRAQTPPTESPVRIADSLQPFVDSHTLAGATVLVASKDKVLDLESVGYADIAAKKPMQTDSLFWIASMSKPITATALMMLVDEGKVNLDDPVEKYLPEFRGQMVAVEQDNDHMLLKKPIHPITVRNVLSHTSGLPFMSQVEPKLDLFPLSEAAMIYALTPLTFQPDSKYEYSNAGINTAGRIVEVVSHMPYEKFLQERLFEPLGMKDTTFWPNDEQLGRLAKSYKPSADKKDLEETVVNCLTYPLNNRQRTPCPAGGLFSTAADCGVFGQMILNGGVYQGKRYFSESALRQMTSTQTGNLLDKEHGEQGYGLGWSTTRTIHADSDPALVGECNHGGAYSTFLWVDPQRQLVTVFMVQHAQFRDGVGGQILNACRETANRFAQQGEQSKK